MYTGTATCDIAVVERGALFVTTQASTATRCVPDNPLKIARDEHVQRYLLLASTTPTPRSATAVGHNERTVERVSSPLT